MKPTKKMLYRLLFDALIDMRVRGYESGDEAIFALSDMFHNVPLQLDGLDRNELSVQDILQEVRERARRHHDAEGWLELRMREIARNHPEAVANKDAAE